MADIVETLSARIDAVLGPLLAGRQRIFLLDAPDYANVGDPAILLGQLAAVRRHAPAAELVIASHRTFAADMVRPDDLLLLCGGGTFGDIWPVHHRFRLDVLRRFPKNPIVQCPQSISFSDPALVEETRVAIAAASAFVLLARDDRTFAFATERLGGDVRLCPDMAFALGHLPARPATLDAFCLLRTDKEQLEAKNAAVAAALSARAMTFAIADWLDGDAAVRRLLGLHRRLARAGAPGATAYGNFAFERYARSRLAHGVAMLSRGATVVTDRLHGQIVATLLGRPVMVFDSLDGKVAAFRRTWLADAPGNTLLAGIDEFSHALGPVRDRLAA